MLEDIGKNNNPNNNNNNKTILLLITDNIEHYQQQFNNYIINNYKITLVNWNDILNLDKNSDCDIKHKNPKLVILDISTTVVEGAKFNKLTTIMGEIRKTFSDKRIFFILPSESVRENFLSMGICAKEDIRIQPFSIFDVIDLISITKKKERLDRLELKDHSMHTYSSPEDKIKDAIKFLKIGIKNNQKTLILLDKNIQESYLKAQMDLHDLDTSKLQDNGLLKVIYSEEYYLSFNQKDNNKINTVTVDNEKIHEKCANLVDQAINKEGKKGLRIFAMMDCFFEYGLVDELLEYECGLSPKFNKPQLGICAYNNKHISQLSKDQIRKLILTHSRVWI
jgi:hypothetical protein